MGSPAPELSALRIERAAKRPRRLGRALAILALLLVLGAAGGYLWLSSRSHTFSVTAPVLSALSVEKTSAAFVTDGQALTVLSASGYVDAETRADISPKITSRITELNVTEGSRVKKGEVIARLDHTDLDAQLADTMADWENARIDLERQRRLVARASRPARPRSAVAAEATRHAKANYVRALLDYTVLRAPFDGVVVAKRAHVGEAVSPYGAPGQGSSQAAAIVTLVDFSSLYVGADVNEANLSRLSKEQPAEIVLDAYPKSVYHGVLRQIIPAADRQKGTVKVKVTILDPDEKILPDLSAKVSFTSEPTRGRAARTAVEVARKAARDTRRTGGVWS